MMTTALAAAASVALAGTAAQAASPVTGVWRAPVGHATIEVYDCGPQTVCGRVVNSDNLRTDPDMRDVHNPDTALRARPVRGLQMMRDFRGGPVRWSEGLLYNPQDGRTYHGTITLVDAHTLKLAGCIFGPLCRTQVWTRAP